MIQESISNRRRIFEITAVVLTAVGKFIFMDYLNWRFPFVLTAILIWTGYIIWRRRTKNGILGYWGFRTDNFKTATYKVLPFGLFAVAACMVIGYVQGTINMTWHIIPILLLYPLWGIIQQFLMIGLVAGNLQDMQGRNFNKIIVIVLTATLFALVHYPSNWLILGTFILALFYGYVYLNTRNVYVLGLFHGWLAALFYYTVLNEDPFLRTFGRFLV